MADKVTQKFFVMKCKHVFNQTQNVDWWVWKVLKPMLAPTRYNQSPSTLSSRRSILSVLSICNTHLKHSSCISGISRHSEQTLPTGSHSRDPTITVISSHPCKVPFLYKLLLVSGRALLLCSTLVSLTLQADISIALKGDCTTS